MNTDGQCGSHMKVCNRGLARAGTKLVFLSKPSASTGSICHEQGALSANLYTIRRRSHVEGIFECTDGKLLESSHVLPK